MLLVLYFLENVSSLRLTATHIVFRAICGIVISELGFLFTCVCVIRLFSFGVQLFLNVFCMLPGVVFFLHGMPDVWETLFYQWVLKVSEEPSFP